MLAVDSRIGDLSKTATQSVRLQEVRMRAIIRAGIARPH